MATLKKIICKVKIEQMKLIFFPEKKGSKKYVLIKSRTTKNSLVQVQRKITIEVNVTKFGTQKLRFKLNEKTFFLPNKVCITNYG